MSIADDRTGASRPPALCGDLSFPLSLSRATKNISWPTACPASALPTRSSSCSTAATIASPEIARRFTDRVIEGAWEREGERRNAGIAACRGDWVLEIDADERVGPELAAEIAAVIAQLAGRLAPDPGR